METKVLVWKAKGTGKWVAQMYNAATEEYLQMTMGLLYAGEGCYGTLISSVAYFIRDKDDPEFVTWAKKHVPNVVF